MGNDKNIFYTNLKFFLLILALLFSLNAPVEAQAALNPKLKVMGTLALYGTVGGALLGTASLAYGARKRWIFRGASLGLYAGLIFGTYVLVSHQYKRSKSPGEVEGGDSDYIMGGGYGGDGATEAKYWISTLDDRNDHNSRSHFFSSKQETPFSLGLFYFQF